MDEYGFQAAEALGVWFGRWAIARLDPAVDWSRYRCRKCGALLGFESVEIGIRYPVIRPHPDMERVPWWDERGKGPTRLEATHQAHDAQFHRPRWKPTRGHPPVSASRAPIRIIVYRNGRTGFGATVGSVKEITRRLELGTMILADRRFESHQDASDFFHWFTFFKPHRERLLARERKRHERRRSRVRTAA